MTDFKVGAHSYKIGRMDLFRQVHVLRRLGPVIPALTVIWRANANGVDIIDAAAAMGVHLLEALTRLSDADAEYVINSCLSLAQRQQGPLWADVATPGGGMMFEDIALYDLGVIVFRVLENTFRPFASALLATATAGQKAA